MTNSVPAPASSRETAFRTYTRAAVFLFPALLVWLFTYIYLLTRLQMIWETLGITGSRLKWLIEASDAFINYGRLILAGIVLAFFSLERFSRSWPRWRRGAVGSITFLINAAVLLALAALLTSTLTVYSQYLSPPE